MSGHRQAAVALHALTPTDQDLILAELPEADQERLRAYLAELTELGFDVPAPQTAPARLFSFAPRAPLTPQARVRGASAEAMADLLINEPAALVAQVLGSADWPWRAQYLATLPAARGKQVQGALDAQRAAAPACAAFLVEELAGMLERQPAPAPRSGLSQLLTRAAAWTR